MIRCRPSLTFPGPVFLVMGFISMLTLFAPATHASPTLSVEQPVYFLSPDEEPLLVAPGSYQVEVADAWLKLIPHEGGRAEALLLHAQSGTHGEELATPKVLLIPVEEQPDIRQLTLLLPDGTDLEAVGSMTGVWPRALLKGHLSGNISQRNPQLRPDLVITSYNHETNFLQVKNIGNAPAVFSQGGPLVSWFAEAPGGTVPAGGVIQPGQTITLNQSPPAAPPVGLRSWYCPGPVDPTQYAYIYPYSWPYALPQPNGPEGYSKSVLLVDPENRVQESNEVNNVYVASRPNPHQSVLQGSGSPDLIVSSVATNIQNQNGRWLTIGIKNIGSKTGYWCAKRDLNSNFAIGPELLKAYVDGSDIVANSPLTWTYSQSEPLILDPGEELTETKFFLRDATQNQYGIWSNGLQPGCHEVRLVLNRKSEFEGDRTCNNETFYHYASGGASCGTMKIMHTSSCTPLQRQPLSQKNELLRSPSQRPSLPSDLIQQKKTTP
ncbi:MAG: hypothetical protein OEY80_10460 [Nitrospirota bacterium]|nr:hypothetical protein [Nitrospirota bacterium]